MLKKTRSGNPLATKAQLKSRINSLVSVSNSLAKALSIESNAKEGLHSSEWEEFEQSAQSALDVAEKAISRMRSRLESGKHN